MAVYANTFSAPFIFDDNLAILNNASIRQLWPPWSALSPPVSVAGATGRPLVNLSLAVNYAVGGLHVEGYHALNLLFHMAVTLTLFGCVRRTLLLPRLREGWGQLASPVAFFASLLWTVHPLLTEAVTCVVQRNELMVALCYLHVLYGLVRADQSAAPTRWLASSFVACVLGMFCKEVMVSAPLVAYAYQALLIDGAWSTAWRRRGKFFLLLATSWIPLGLLVAGSSRRGDAAGFGLGLTWWEYALTQCQAILHYVRLSFWPHPLILDYGNPVVRNLAEVWPQLLALIVAVATTVSAAARKWPAAFLGIAFFALLAPSSSVVPLVTQTVAEHRMYLPLAALCVLVVGAIASRFGTRALTPLLIVTVASGFLTFQRNAAYGSGISIWSDTLANVPRNARAHANLGGEWEKAGRFDDALREFDLALQIQPDYAEVHTMFGRVSERLGRREDATAHYEAAIRLEPKTAQAHYNLGNIFVQQQRWTDAEREFSTTLELHPEFPDVHFQLGVVLAAVKRYAEAVPHFEIAVRDAPNDPERQFGLATALSFVGRTDDAIAHFERVTALASDRADAHFRLGALLAKSGRAGQAIPHFQSAVRLSPQYAEAHFLLGYSFLQEGRKAEAVAALQTALQVRPDFAEARRLLEQLGAKQP